ncbi:hypothetical protein N7513_001922 [Penicillium frequentans]|nr:hypothetical protein N7513_001922 [Penicillium glabrum]
MLDRTGGTLREPDPASRCLITESAIGTIVRPVYGVVDDPGRSKLTKPCGNGRRHVQAARPAEIVAKMMGKDSLLHK